MRTRPVLLVPALLGVILVLSGCGGVVDSAKSQVGKAVSTATCSLVAQAKTDPAKAKASLTAAGDKITASLDQLSTALSC